MSYFWDEFRSLIFACLFLGAGFVAFFIGVNWWGNNFVENIPSVVKVDGKTVYEGPSCGYDVESSGANTTVTVRGGFLHLFPRAYYVSRDVQVIGEKK